MHRNPENTTPKQPLRKKIGCKHPRLRIPWKQHRWISQTFAVRDGARQAFWAMISRKQNWIRSFEIERRPSRRSPSFLFWGGGLFGTRGSANLSWSLTGEMDVAIVFLILCCLNLRVVEGRSLGRWSNLTSIFFKWVFQPPTSKWASQLYLICYHSWWSRQVWRAGGRTILLHAWTRGGIDQGLRPLGQKESVVLLPWVSRRIHVW